MAGIPMGASTPTASAHPQATPKRTILRLAASSRTRRNHGAFLVGDHLATVCSTRREGDAQGVLLQFGGSSLTLSGAMTPAQARVMALALTAAAQAAEAAQRRGFPQRQQEGGAA